MVRSHFFAALLISAWFFAGCNALYSPALHLPERPLIKNDGQVVASYGILNDVSGPSNSLGFTDGNDLLVRYAFSDRLSLGVKWWSATSLFKSGFYNGGFLASGIYSVSDRNAPLAFAVIPTWNMLFTNDKVIGMGGSVQLAAWLPKTGKFRFYLASGPGMIANNIQSEQWGYGLISNAGLIYDLTDDIHVNGELAGIWAYRVSTKETFGNIAPSIGLSWNFHNQ